MGIIVALRARQSVGIDPSARSLTAWPGRRGRLSPIRLLSKRPVFRCRSIPGTGDRVTTAHPLADSFLAQRPVLLRYLRARGAAEEAEDLLQDLWLKLAATSGQGVERPESYMMRMAHNLMLDRARATRRRLTRDDHYHRDGAEDSAGPSALADLIARERLDQVDRLLAALGERTDRIFRRHRVEGVAQRDIAAELGISLSAVEKHLQKAYRAIGAWQRGDGVEDRPREGRA